MPTQKGWYLENVDLFGDDFCLGRFVNVGDDRDFEGLGGVLA